MSLPARSPAGCAVPALVDLLARLVGNGTLNVKGQFAPSVPDDGFPLSPGKGELVLTKRDIDIFQRAKAAIGVGIEVLLAKAGMGHNDLRRVCIGGVFGQSLDISSATAIGLLPAIPGRSMETAGNTALSGCEALSVQPISTNACGTHGAGRGSSTCPTVPILTRCF